jgi:hypothetical protein
MALFRRKMDFQNSIFETRFQNAFSVSKKLAKNGIFWCQKGALCGILFPLKMWKAKIVGNYTKIGKNFDFLVVAVGILASGVRACLKGLGTPVRTPLAVFFYFSSNYTTRGQDNGTQKPMHFCKVQKSAASRQKNF